jgi:eukaryotic-like serine/threonine-protein kinase
VLGISTDSVATHERWLAASRADGGLGGLHFPLAADEDGTASRAYGVYLERQHVALRGLFLIDPNGVLQYQVVHSLTVGRHTEEILRVLEGLQMGGLCPGERQRGEPALDVGSVLGPNRVLGPYRIEAELGGGSFGTVFRAHDQTLDRQVALKVLRPGGSVPATALLGEARAAAAVLHPNVCIIHAVDSSTGAPMIVMEYVAGRPLAEKLAQGPMPPEQAAALVRQVALGMAAAHAQGVVHGDLKPANVLVTAAGTVKLVDFGMARRSAAPVSGDETGRWDPATAGGISGTPAYMAPEQALGQPATPASDVFSLGMMLYELLTGRRARVGGDLREFFQQMVREDLTRDLEGVPDPFAALLRTTLAPEPAQRRLTMKEIAERLGQEI